MLRLFVAVVVANALLPGIGHAQSSASVEMTADRNELNVGEVMRLRIRAELTNLPDGQLELPSIDGFRVVGRSVSRPSQIQFFGGRTRIVSTSEIQELTLQALQPGTHRIPPARIRAGRRTYESRPLVVRVGAGGAPSDDVPSDESSSESAPSSPPAVEGGTFDSVAFLRTIVDKPEPFVGEQITVTVYLYVRNPLRSAPLVAREASTDGFWVHDLLPVNRTMESTQQVVRGTPFRVYVLRRFAAFPIRPGPLTIGAAKVRIETGSLFDLLGGSSPLTREGEPVPIAVRALPDPKRPHAAVGTFAAQAELDRDQISTGDAVTFRVRVQGEGNLHDLDLRLPEVPGLRILAPRIQDDIRPSGDRLGGTRSFEWLIIPERPGTYALPSLGFDRFDPSTERYATVRIDAPTIVAVGRAVDAAVAEGDAVTREDAPRFGPVRTKSAFLREEPPMSSAPWYPWALCVPPLLWLGVVTVGASRRHLRAREAKDAPKRATRAAHARLVVAERAARANDPGAFYSEIASALSDMLETRLGEAIGGHTHAALRSYLPSRGMDEDLARRIVDELEGCDFARFSAAGVEHAEMDRCLSRVRALFERLSRFEPQEKAS